MDVVSLCPFRVGSLLWQPQRGAWNLTVVCKATYDLLPVESRLADEQEYPSEDDNHWNDDDARSLYLPSDLAPFKVRGDVMLVGHAFAPGGQPVRSVVARLIVGDVDKAIEVHLDRWWTQEGQLREGSRFNKMPLRYERAAGGPDTSNPVGVRADARPDIYGQTSIANLQQPGMLLSDRSDFIEPIGFGPIAPGWPSRRDKLGRHGATWSQSNWHSEPLPPDIDQSYFNAAPRDQQTASIRDNERIILENLHPQHPRLLTSLPGVRPRAFIDRRGAAPQELAMAADTLWIDTDRSICTLTWRTRVAVEGPAQPGRVVIGMEMVGQRLTFADLERRSAEVIELDSVELIDQETADVPNLKLPRPGEGGRPPLGGATPTISKAPTPPASQVGAPPSDRDPSVLRPRRPNSSTMSMPIKGVGSALPFVASSAQSFPSSPPAGSNPATNANEQTGESAPQGGDGPAWLNKRTKTVATSDTEAADDRGSPAWLNQRAATVAQSQSGAIPPPPPPAVVQPPPAAAAPVPPAVMQSPPLPPAVVPAPGGGPMAQPGPVPPPPAIVTGGMARGTSASSAVPDSPWAGGAMDPRAEAMHVPLAPSPNMIAARDASGPSQGAGATGATAASNAAAASGGGWSPVAPPAPVEAPAAAPAPRAAPRGMPAREVTDLLWYDPEFLAKIRKKAAWKEIFEEIAPKAPDLGFDEEPPPPPPQEEVDSRDLFGVLTRGAPVDTQGVEEAIGDAVEDDGTFRPPIILIAGDLSFPFDELETLKATVTAVSPLIAGDKKLKETVDTVKELMNTTWTQGSGTVAESLTARVKEAFAQGNRMLPPSYLESHTERILMEQRHYQRRTVFGALFIRSMLSAFGTQTPIPTYVPDSLSKKLPMFQRLKVRLICEAHGQQDQFESHSSALRVVVLGRVLPITRR
jgi:hypothetical protein